MEHKVWDTVLIFPNVPCWQQVMSKIISDYLMRKCMSIHDDIGHPGSGIQCDNTLLVPGGAICAYKYNCQNITVALHMRHGVSSH